MSQRLFVVCLQCVRTEHNRRLSLRISMSCEHTLMLMVDLDLPSDNGCLDQYRRHVAPRSWMNYFNERVLPPVSRSTELLNCEYSVVDEWREDRRAWLTSDLTSSSDVRLSRCLDLSLPDQLRRHSPDISSHLRFISDAFRQLSAKISVGTTIKVHY